MLNTSDNPSTIEELSLENNNQCKICVKNLTVERDLREQLTAAQELAKRYETELVGERSYRKDLELKLSTLNFDVENKIEKCLKTNNTFEQRLDLLFKKQESDFEAMKNHLSCAKTKYKNIEMELIKLNKKYHKLLGLNREHANKMREKDIELPQTVDQLEFLALQLREELIETRSAYEHSVNELKDELTIAKEQNFEMEKKLQTTEKLLHEIDCENKLHESCENLRISNSQEIINYQRIIGELEHQIASMQRDRTKNEISLNEYKCKCITLQQGLDTCETVQKDFVQLSQKLQIQLEKIRQAEKEVRWQFEDDVLACNKCEILFDIKNNHKDKMHCRHCGKIFCENCLTNKVTSGLNGKQAEVCDVCYTLLNSESVPFFSNMPFINEKIGT